MKNTNRTTTHIGDQIYIDRSRHSVFWGEKAAAKLYTSGMFQTYLLILISCYCHEGRLWKGCHKVSLYFQVRVEKVHVDAGDVLLHGHQ